MSRGIIINNPGAVETVVNLSTIRALDGDTIYTGSVYLSDISEDEIDAVKSAVEAYSPTPGPGPGPTPGPEIEPFYVPGWFEHQDGNWVLVKAGQTWEIQYSDNGSSWTDASYTASDVDTWFNMDNEPFRQAKYIKRKNTSSSAGNKILAMNLDMPNYIDAWGETGTTVRYTIFNDISLINVKIKIDHFEGYLRCAFYDNEQMTTCEIEMYRPELMKVNSDMERIFAGCYSLQSLKGLENWNVENAAIMQYMFNNCRSLLSLEGIENWNVENAINMQQMFTACYSLRSLNLSNWNIEKVTSIYMMFSGCYSLQSIKGLENWNIEKVTNLNQMFQNCHSLQSLDLSDWNVSNVTSMSYIFSGCYSLQSLDLSNWNIEKAVSVSRAFDNCYALKDLKIKSKPKTQTLSPPSQDTLSNNSLQWMADNFPDISGDDTYTNKTISGLVTTLVKARYMWNYFYNTMTAKGYTIS